MASEILTIGDELIRGDVVDTNSVFLASRLAELGIEARWLTSTTDDAGDIREALSLAFSRADRVFISGGLGPTEDDRTVDVLSSLLERPTEMHEPSLVRMRERFARRNANRPPGQGQQEMPPNNLRQVRILVGSQALENPVGIAPGFALEHGRGLPGAKVYVMPGVPTELKAIFEAHVAPELTGSEAAQMIAKTLHIYGLPESHVGNLLEGMVGADSPASVHYRIVFPENEVKLVVRKRSADGQAAEARAQALLGSLEKEARRRLGPHVYGTDGDRFSAATLRKLRSQGATLAVAESCTGGLVAHWLTSISGSSDCFRLGVVAYANRIKQQVLGVRPEVLLRDGAVSEACAREMAEGVRRIGQATWAVAITGVAGPEGGTETKPVGTVWIALCGPVGPGTSETATRAERFLFSGNREQIQKLAAHRSLAMVYEALGAAEQPAPTTES